ncbi:hypothetical protein RHDC4_02784 [Rhodocyclaceae bacterium]|nr:hypothetical protein RHDC4_02784 [Rhodocyclaceae bacterium]
MCFYIVYTLWPGFKLFHTAVMSIAGSCRRWQIGRIVGAGGCATLGEQKRHREGGVVVVWWRRRESNPRPQALYRQYYMLSLVV